MTQAGAASVEGLRRIFDGRLLTEPHDMAPFLMDWRRRWTGRAIAVAQPSSVAGVADILRWCANAGVSVVPQGGNTSLSGGSVPDESGRALLLSLTRLNAIRAVDRAGSTMIAEAGCTLRQVQAAAEEAALLFPLSLAAEGSCTIGGNLATNAGGVHVLRYGSARDLCLGLEVVTASGEVWNGLRGLRKDNSGYDLRDLFIGSEGTLGVITAAVLRLFPRPAERIAAFAAVPSPAAAMDLLRAAQARLGAGLTAFEVMNRTSIDLVLRHRSDTRLPLREPSPWYALMEVSAWSGDPPAAAAMVGLLEAATASAWVGDAVVSASGAQFAALWVLREAASDAQAAEGATIKHDIALPLAGIAGFIATAEAAIGRQYPGLRLVIWGHFGDGNLHYNISPPAALCTPEHAAWFLDLEPGLNRLVHDLVVSCGGSISAEHGLGVLRRDEAARFKSPVEQRMMRAIKAALDPGGVLNPGKLLR